MNSDNLNNQEPSDKLPERKEAEPEKDNSVFSDDIIKQYNKKIRRKNAIGFFAAVLILAGFFIAIITVFYGPDWIDIFSKKENYNINITIPVQEKPKSDVSLYDEQTGLYTAQGIAERVMPSVVSVLCYQEGEFSAVSQGSGIILTENGYIITNAHVIEDASKAIRVILNNEKEYPAEIVGSDAKTDLAVLKINAEGLTSADFGKSSELSIGEDIIAIGSPGGLYSSLTKGVVSGLNRMIKTDPTHIDMDCIQIDAAINPGNSGGALVNMYGQVVGINTSKFSSDTYDGIGFAISIDAAIPILEQLIADGYIKDRVRIGITFYEISEDVAEIYGLVAGLQIEAIDETCDISKTELAVGDTITHINDKKVLTRNDVSEVLEGAKPDDTVKATVVRTLESGEQDVFEIEFKLMKDTSMQIKDSEN